MTVGEDLVRALNLRDVGGLRTEDGGRTVSGRLYRSGRLDELAPQARRALVAELGVTDVVDLRQRPGTHEGVEANVHHLHLVPVGERPVVDPVDTYDSVADWYLRMVTIGAPSIRRIVELVATSEGATLIHCHAGKDRTGSVVGVILSAVGVVDDDVVRDYSTTGTIVGDSFLDSLPRKFSESHPEAMARFLAKLAQRFGSASGFLEAVGVDPGTIGALRQRMVARDG